ncbi:MULTISPECIES: hypothetical protein [Nostoc]|uniref:Uncharacterized protein n=2 Tax=Nostoc TaxID=1177 RepID=A0ABR8I840_9NOSO|nr:MULTISPECIES: hypothetical protein [Nostoc]MBD2561729.1 hypothetical protein [Nostoc linckia FACHB-391]MBD2647369.1 hypothetical protein [Nostoc foliaceum FACHB-393]
MKTLTRIIVQVSRPGGSSAKAHPSYSLPAMPPIHADSSLRREEVPSSRSTTVT